MEIVESLLKTLYYRRRYLALRETNKRMLKPETEGLPSIVLDVSTDPLSPPDGDFGGSLSLLPSTSAHINPDQPLAPIPTLWRRMTRSVAKRDLGSTITIVDDTRGQRRQNREMRGGQRGHTRGPSDLGMIHPNTVDDDDL